MASGNDAVRDTGLMLTEAVLTLGLVQFPTKFIVGRSRPDAGRGNHSYKAFGGTTQERASFFSGHSATAFSVSTVLAKTIDHPLATVGLYALAAVTPVARIYDDRHWFSDTLVGSAVGIYIGRQVFKAHREEFPKEAKLILLPAPNGVFLSYRF